MHHVVVEYAQLCFSLKMGNSEIKKYISLFHEKEIMEQLFIGQKKRKKDIKIDYSKKKENFFVICCMIVGLTNTIVLGYIRCIF